MIVAGRQAMQDRQTRQYRRSCKENMKLKNFESGAAVFAISSDLFLIIPTDSQFEKSVG